jgi:uncharacterized protein YndB with AHSA1/START domain
MNPKNSPVTPLVVERTLHASPAQVWQALTTAAALQKWMFDIKEFKPEVGFEFQFTVECNNFTYIHCCRIVEAVPQKRLAYTWRFEGHEGDSVVTYELFPEGGGTRVKLTHVGLGTFPALPNFARHNFEEGWTFLLGQSLAEFLEGPTKSDPACEIVVYRVFDAPRELVWQAMTDPKHVIHWWGPNGFTTTVEQMDVHVGGIWKFVMHGPDGVNYPNKSVFLEVVKPERVVYRHGGGREHGPGASFIGTWTFEAEGAGQTKVTIRLAFASPEEREFVIKEFSALEGGKQTLGRLGEYLPKMPPLH